MRLHFGVRRFSVLALIGGENNGISELESLFTCRRHLVLVTPHGTTGHLSSIQSLLRLLRIRFPCRVDRATLGHARIDQCSTGRAVTLNLYLIRLAHLSPLSLVLPLLLNICQVRAQMLQITRLQKSKFLRTYIVFSVFTSTDCSHRFHLSLSL